MLFIFAMSNCMESFLGEKVRNVWSLRFSDNSNFDANVEYWKKMIKVIMPIASGSLENVVKDGLKSKEAADSAVLTVAGILAAIQGMMRTEFLDIKTVMNFS